MMGEFTCLVGLNRARIFLEFGWPQWGKSMSERAEKAEALAARIKPILAGTDPDIKGKRRRSFLPAPFHSGHRDRRANLDVGNTCCLCNPNRSIRPNGDFPIPVFVRYGQNRSFRRGVCVLDSGDQLRVVSPGFCISAVRSGSEQDDLSCDEVAALTALALNAHLRPCFQIRSGAFRYRVHARLRIEAYHEAYALTSRGGGEVA